MAGGKGTRVTVYGLCSSEDGELRYIGQTINQDLGKRLLIHKAHARRWPNANHRQRWIYKALTAGYEILIFPIEVDALYMEAEIRLIAFYKDRGANLVNSSDGGEGAAGAVRSDETRRKISAGHKGMKKPWASLAQKGRKKQWLAERNRARAGKLTGKKRSAEAICKQVMTFKKGYKGKTLSDEHKARISASLIGNKRALGSTLNDEMKKELAVARRARWALRKVATRMSAA